MDFKYLKTLQHPDMINKPGEAVVVLQTPPLLIK